MGGTQSAEETARAVREMDMERMKVQIERDMMNMQQEATTQKLRSAYENDDPGKRSVLVAWESGRNQLKSMDAVLIGAHNTKTTLLEAQCTTRRVEMMQKATVAMNKCLKQPGMSSGSAAKAVIAHDYAARQIQGVAESMNNAFGVVRGDEMDNEEAKLIEALGPGSAHLLEPVGVSAAMASLASLSEPITSSARFAPSTVPMR